MPAPDQGPLRLTGELRLTLPDGQALTARTDPPAPEPADAAQLGDGGGPVAGLDFSTVSWQGQRFAFTPQQRAVVATLWRAWESGEPFVSGSHLLEICGSCQRSLFLVFRGNPAWNSLVVSGAPFGGPPDSFCLAWAR